MARLDIQIQTRKMVKPSTPTPNHLRSLKLSFFDQGAPRMYVPILFHYLPTSEGSIAERCDKLQKSLSQTLTKFYPLAGRFSEDEFTIHCNDEGVEYLETKVNADLAVFLYQGPNNIEVLDDLLPTDMPSSPLLGIQVNIFNCGGLVMGINISHILADGFTLGTFVKEWSHISQTGTTKDCLPSFGGFSSLFPTRVLSGPQFSAPSNKDPNIITKRFVFDALAIAKLKNRTNSSATFTRPTRVVVVLSLIWKVLVGISSAKHGHSRESSLLFPINLRGKSNLSSLEHALGNFYVTVVATLEAKQRKELNDFVNVVGSTTRDISANIGKASIDDITSLSITYGTEVVNKLGQKDVDNYPSTSWCRFPWYEADFGWGKPSWVSSVSKNYEGISLIDTKSGDGIEAWIGLKEKDMADFERDPDILSFTSKAAFDSSGNCFGVEYVETKVHADLAEYLHEGPNNIELLDDLLPTDTPSSPLRGIQVNTFNCEGLVMGINISHILADGFTLGTFVKEWAHISQTGTTKDCLSSFGGLWSLFPTRVQSGSLFSAPSNRDPSIVTKRFVFDSLAIAKLKNRTSPSATSTRPTRVEVVTSLIWKTRKELSDFVNVVGSTTRDIAATIGKASIDDITSLFVTRGTEVVNKFGQKDVDNYPITSWCRFPWYEADFGWGKPSWVSSVSKNYEGISLIDTKSEDGIEAWIGLKEKDMAEFERDPDILSTSKVASDPLGFDTSISLN
ncbi:hypothetical protein HAX54_000882 [Datura stramonium]|uniref:Uncharacterized protein n=1 Tax=Datura stramonium TaxID=4076 RepID=A0ABS8RS65_DATST|nr:hypothetical protein [Datura stramonium]